MKYGKLDLGQIEAIVNKLGGTDGVQRFLSDEMKVVAVAKRLLKLLGTVAVSATIAKFVARDKFVVNTDKNAPVKISYIGDNFQNWFLDKTEEPKVETTLRYAELTKSSVDGLILAELGNTAETTLAGIYALMERQPNGENEALLTNGYANIFYVRDVNGVLRAVNVYWYGGGWFVIAFSVEFPSTWFVGFRVFSRNS